MNIILIYITAPNKNTAVKISRRLLQRRLIACANIFPINSLYWWNKKITSGKEWTIIAKTKNKLYGKIKEEVEGMHPYTVPCITKIPGQANKKYFSWLNQEIS